MVVDEHVECGQEGVSVFTHTLILDTLLPCPNLGATSHDLHGIDHLGELLLIVGGEQVGVPHRDTGHRGQHERDAGRAERDLPPTGYAYEFPFTRRIRSSDVRRVRDQVQRPEVGFPMLLLELPDESGEPKERKWYLCGATCRQCRPATRRRVDSNRHAVRRHPARVLRPSGVHCGRTGDRQVSSSPTDSASCRQAVSQLRPRRRPRPAGGRPHLLTGHSDRGQRGARRRPLAAPSTDSASSMISRPTSCSA